MLDNIKSSFSIRDLHHLTGISLHTIRIWERRFDFLQPERSGTNIRQYSIDDLKKLLNISLLVKNGYKISELALMNNQQLNTLVNSTSSVQNTSQVYIDNLKMSMMEFDASLFNDTYNRLISEMTFYDVFIKVFIPFLEQIGKLWQTSSITVAQEHFISNLIRQKLFFNIEKLPRQSAPGNRKFVLFLPVGELHELGLLFFHYVLLVNGRESVYLGQDVEMETLNGILNTEKQLTFISYLTITPNENALPEYVTEFRKKILQNNNELWISGRKVHGFKKNKSWNNVLAFPDVKELLEKICQ